MPSSDEGQVVSEQALVCGAHLPGRSPALWAGSLVTEHTEKKLKSAATQIGVSEAEVIERALDMLLLAEEVHGLAKLKEDMDYWQELFAQSAALTDERIAQHTHGEG